MKVNSTILAGPGCGPLMLDALRSARGAVDEHLIICSDIGADELQAFLDAYEKEPFEQRCPLHTANYQWADDMAAARNSRSGARTVSALTGPSRSTLTSN